MPNDVTALLERVADPAPAPSTEPLLPQINARLVETKDELARLQRSLPAVALAAATNPNALDEHAALQSRIATVTAEVELLEQARAGAEAHDKRLVQQQIAALRATDLHSLKIRLGKRDKAARELQDHLAKAIAAYQELVKHSENAFGSLQRLGGFKLQDHGNMLLTGMTIQKAVDVEAYCLSNPAERGPGLTIQWPTQTKYIMTTSRPPTLADRIADASRRALAIATGEVDQW